MNEAAVEHSHVTVGQSPELLHAEGLFLDVILGEKPRLTRYHLLDGGIYHQIVYVVVGTPRLPALWRNHLRKTEPLI